jgi:acetyl esterase/lipase
MHWWMLGLGVFGWLLAANALRPVRWPTTAGLLAFWFGWLVGDLPVLTVLAQAATAAGLLAMGATSHGAGIVGLVLLMSSWIGLFFVHQIAHSAAQVMDDTLDRAGILESSESWKARRLLLPFPQPRASGVFVAENLRIRTVGRWTQKVDVFAPNQPGRGRPVLVFAHGGGWVMSFRRFQGLPLMLRLAARGWVCVRVSYRLSPGACFPEHLIDVKHGLAWARENAHRWGGDPDDFFALHGNSAGAQLACLAALTPNDPAYQPGFEDQNTAIDACVPVYSPTDLLNRSGEWGPEFGWFLRWLMLQQPKGHPVWHEASPIERVHADAPPFLVVHGAQDTLVPVGEGRRFAQALREVGVRCDFVSIPGGQHALDVLHSRRGIVVADGIARWLAHMRLVHQGQLEAGPSAVEG